MPESPIHGPLIEILFYIKQKILVKTVSHSFHLNYFFHMYILHIPAARSASMV